MPDLWWATSGRPNTVPGLRCPANLVKAKTIRTIITAEKDCVLYTIPFYFLFFISMNIPYNYPDP
jgi:hypothetical protein